MKALLFDLGRVLVHYDHVRTLSSLASVCRTGARVPLLLRDILEPLQVGGMDCDELHTLFLERAGATPSRALFCDAFCAGLARDERALAYAVDLEQRDGLLVGVLSNTNAIHVRWLDEHVPELRTFDLVMMSSEVGLQKPDPAAYRLALELLDVRAEEALFVDDLAENVVAAQALGMAGIVHDAWDRTAPQIEEWLRGR